MAEYKKATKIKVSKRCLTIQILKRQEYFLGGQRHTLLDYSSLFGV